jgi:hypothetical protein
MLFYLSLCLQFLRNLYHEYIRFRRYVAQRTWAEMGSVGLVEDGGGRGKGEGDVGGYPEQSGGYVG